MNKDFDDEFHKEIGRILYDLYYNPIPNMEDKRNVIKAERKYIQYLVDNDFVKSLGNGGYVLQYKGYVVFEKYDGWGNYKKQVIDVENTLQKSIKTQIKYWWVPILISALAFIISILAYLK
ncbi:MAG: hypothetical protein PHH72_10905 [Parabacteroides sp.]|jgi:hypothetical protein|nr:hypothetical protein [Ignavibacterium sp.]MDD3359518.1 hypothetical protein [Parabacteroides sp.]MDD4404053.1 hypothetical protein [Parabacteroides sp.]